MALTGKSPTSEKRKHPRFNLDLPVKYGGTALAIKHGRVVNASEGGLLVHLPEEMGIGQNLSLQLFFPPRSELNTLETFVQVVWKRIHMRKDWGWDYRTGVRFVNNSPEKVTKFRNFLMSLAKERPDPS